MHNTNGGWWVGAQTGTPGNYKLTDTPLLATQQPGGPAHAIWSDQKLLQADEAFSLPLHHTSCLRVPLLACQG
jgi:hypothetical protein